MSKFARNTSDNIVLELFVHDTLVPSDTHVKEISDLFVPCPDYVDVGWKFNPTKNEYTPPDPAPTQRKEDIIDLVIPQSSKSGSDFEISLSIKDGETEELKNLDIPVFIPIKNITDGVTYDILSINLTNGYGLSTYSLQNKGVYKIITDQIEPRLNIIDKQIIIY